MLTDFVILFPALWENPPSCHHGTECQLQIHQGWGEYGEGAWIVRRCTPALFGSVRLLAKLSDQAAAYD